MEDMKEFAEAAEAIAEEGNPVITLHNGDKVTIYKCKTKQVGAVLRLVTFVFNEMGVTKIGEIPTIDLENPVVLLQLIAKSTDNVFELATTLCSIKSVEAFEDLDFDDSLAIIVEEFKLNKDFFLKRVLPMISSVQETK